MVTLEIKIRFLGIPDEPRTRPPFNNSTLQWESAMTNPPPVIPDSRWIDPSWTGVTTGTIPQPVTLEDGDIIQVTYTVTTRED
jgi:hypothetical protein